MATDRRIFGGYYKQYDGKMFFVVTVAKDYITEEETVVFFSITYGKKFEYLTMDKKEFCSYVEWNGKKVKRFTRQTQMTNQNQIWDKVFCDGFENVHKIAKPKKNYDFEDVSSLLYRELRSSHTYNDYAKDLCKNYIRDKNKINLCRQCKKYLGVTKEEYQILIEDHRFVTGCFNTVLADFNEYFKERYIDKISIRKYAQAHNMSRGSVEHIERKMLHQLALELKLRDLKDKIYRIITIGDEKTE